MSAYCTYENVVGIIATDLEEAEIELLIANSDVEIDARADMKDKAVSIKKLLSMYLTCEQVAGKEPKTSNLGPATFVATLSPADWRLKAENLVLMTASTTVTSTLPILVHQAGGD